MNFETFFWLHIRKSAGTSARKLLQPNYTEVERMKRPKTFIQAKPEEYNDILNNHRVVLGDYQFRRTLFAKKHLYPDTWESIYSFAFSREPIDRCISMFYYLFYRKTNSISRIAKNIKNHKKIILSASYSFDRFLDLIDKAHNHSESIYMPNLHFTTHTAPMFDDVTDMEGNILLTKVYRMEDLIEGINDVYKQCGIDQVISNEKAHYNKNKKRDYYQPTKLQKQKIMKLYENDFELYENAANIFHK